MRRATRELGSKISVRLAALTSLLVLVLLPAPALASLCTSIERELAEMHLGGPHEGQAHADRRAHLQELHETHACTRAEQKPSRGQPLTAGFFDLSNELPPARLEIRPSMPIDPQPGPRVISRIRGTGLVCVRLCDGYFFPLGQRVSVDQDQNADEMCQRRCPAAETQAFSKPGDIDTAVSSNGRRYASLPNAYRYRRSFDATCTCGDGAQTQRTPIVLNPEPVEPPPHLRGGSERRANISAFGPGGPPPPLPAEPELDPNRPVIPQDHGERREFRDPRSGVSRTVRVIAPELSLVPSGAAAPSAPVRAPVR
jgi:Protein of unknown function (DUF2865)